MQQEKGGRGKSTRDHNFLLGNDSVAKVRHQKIGEKGLESRLPATAGKSNHGTKRKGPQAKPKKACSAEYTMQING